MLTFWSINCRYTYIYGLFNEYVPRRKHVVSNFPQWYSYKLKQKIKIKNFFHKKYKSNSLEYYYSEFSKVRKEVKTLILHDYNIYINNVQNNLKSR